MNFVPLRVKSVERLTRDSVLVEFSANGKEVTFSAGQHLVLRRHSGGKELRRTYSICSSAPSGRLRVAVKRLPGGEFSEWANSELRPGDVLEAMGPEGSFSPRLDPAARRRYLAIAAGSGITPVFSIVATVLEVEPKSTVALWYANRTTEDVMLLEELCDLKDRFLTRFEVLFFMSREEGEAEILSGRLDAARLGRLLASVQPPGAVDEWYLCGPFPMVQDLKATLLSAGVEPGRVHIELFHVGEEAAKKAREPTRAERPQGVSEGTVLLGGRAARLAVPFEGESILEALCAARSDAPYSCKSGVCATCRAKLASGTVEMDACYALDPNEVAAGYVLMCQSHPTSPEVRLEVS
jgi:ring-1,2-phenylacetyl-CoA epoxidase subunit PaaE